MDYFTYKNGEYFAEDVAISAIADEVPTPFYCYSKNTFTHHLTSLQQCLSDIDHKICYAVKANCNLDLLHAAANVGAGADVVSAGEIEFALAAGIKPENIVYSGVAKTKDEMRYGLMQRIFQFNIESDNELEQLQEVAQEVGHIANIAVRVNPDVIANTHAKISTGHKTSKFGIPMDQAIETYKKANKMPNIQIIGISMHIGSQLTNLEPIDQSLGKLIEYVSTLASQGIEIKTIDVGGGLGVPYGNNETVSLENYAALIVKHTQNIDKQIILEPGRMIAANAGILVSRVIRLKDNDGHQFMIIDAGMNDLLRPSLYDAYHEILPCKKPVANTPMQSYDVVGPICETGDIFAEKRELPIIQPNDLLVLRSSGAYGSVMASTYNIRPMIAEIVVDRDKYHISRPARSIKNMLNDYTFNNKEL